MILSGILLECFKIQSSFKSLTAKPADFDKVFDDSVAEYMKNGGKEVMDEKIKIFKEMKK